MISADLLVTGIGEVATLAVGPVPRTGRAMGELGRIPDAALAVADGKFVFVGAARHAARSVKLRRGGVRWDAEGGTALPGFVDAHTHALFAGDRLRELELKVRGASYAEIARAGGGLYATVRRTRRASSEALLASTVGRLLSARALGTTALEVKSGYALTERGEIRLLELIPELARRSGLAIVPTFLGAHAVPPEFARRPDAYVDRLVRRTIPEIVRRGLARFCDVFCEPGFFSVAQSRRLLRAALAHGLGAKVHADEFVASGGARLAAELGVRSAEHLLATPARDLRRLARAGVTAVLLPVTALAVMTSARSPGRECVDAGVPVALGTDLSPNSWVESMPLVLAHGVFSARLTPAEAITAATVNAAHAIGLEATAGQIAVGRPADFVLFDLPSAEHVAYRIGAIPRAVARRGLLHFSA